MMLLRNGCATLAALFLIAAAPRVSAALVYDLRLVGGGKSIDVQRFDVVELELYAVVTGTDGVINEGYQNGYGSIVSTGSSISGGLTGALADLFRGTQSQSGTQADLDGDGDLDIGSNSPASNSDFIFFRANSMVTVAGTTIPNGREFKVATFSFSVDSIATFGGQPVMINFVVPVFDSNPPEALWAEDGRGRDANSDPTAQPTVGLPVLVYAVPEPAVPSMVAIGCLAAAGRRRRRC